MGVPEVAKELHVSESTVWRLLRAGSLASVVEAGRRRVLRSAVERRVRARAASVVKPLTASHPLWRWVGSARSGGVGPGSEDKYGVLSGE
jgi:predicted DNA-binding transcriptional regulator AlpA